MQAGDIREALAKLTAGNAAGHIEVANWLLADGLLLAAFVVAEQCGSGRAAEILSEIEAGVATGEFDPLIAGSVVWSAIKLPTLTDRVGAFSPLWPGIPDCWRTGARQIPPDPQTVAVWGIPAFYAWNDPEGGFASQLKCVAVAHSRGCTDATVRSILASDVLDCQVVVAIVFTVAYNYNWRVPESLVEEFVSAIERAQQRQRPPLVLPPIII